MNHLMRRRGHRRPRHPAAAALVATLVAGFLVLVPGQAADALLFPIVVTTSVDLPDSSPGDGLCSISGGPDCSLRAAIMEANASLGHDTIVLFSTTFAMTLSGAGEDQGLTGDFDITDDLTIEGQGAQVDGTELDRVFDIRPNPSSSLMPAVALVDMRISGGSVSGSGGGIRYDGAPSLFSRLQLGNTVVQNNSATDGGGIYATGGGVAVSGGAISTNVASVGAGGGIAASGAPVHLDGTLVADNQAAAGGGGIFSSNAFGPQAGVVVLQGAVTGNSALFGGGINATSSSVLITGSSLTENTASSGGGGIAATASPVSIVDSTLSENTAPGDGGGVHSSLDVVSILRSTLSENGAGGNGGGVFVVGTAAIRNSTLSGNQAARGGAIFTQFGATFLTSSTVAGNIATTGTSGGLGVFDSSSTVGVESTILANSPANCDAAVDSLGYNIDSAATCGLGEPSDLPFTDPQLMALASYGGSTETQDLTASSPAIDHIPLGVASCGGGTDQRGIGRPQNAGTSACDVGAVEFQPALSGRVTRTDTGVPLDGIRVRAWLGNVTVAETFTDMDGTYGFRTMAAGTYKVSFQSVAVEYFTEYWNDKPKLATADTLVHDGSSVIAGIDAALAPASSVSGTVTDALSGVPLASRMVKIYRSNGTQLDKTFTDASGQWRLDLLAPGTYFLEFAGNTSHVGEFWDDKPTKPQATAVVVPARVDLTGFDATLMPADAIGGAVTSQGSGLPLAGAQVKLLRNDGSVITKLTTGPTGTYAFTGLAPGTYRLVFSAAGRLTEYWNDKTTLATSSSIVLTPLGGDETADAALAP